MTYLDALGLVALGVLVGVFLMALLFVSQRSETSANYIDWGMEDERDVDI